MKYPEPPDGLLREFRASPYDWHGTRPYAIPSSTSGVDRHPCRSSAIDAQQKIQPFVSAGPRFTGQDGQELCARVKALEVYSYGYRDAGNKPLDCRYGAKP